MEAIVVALIGALATIAAAIITTRNSAASSSPAYRHGSTKRKSDYASPPTDLKAPTTIHPALPADEDMRTKRYAGNPITSRLSWALAWGMIGVVFVNIYLVVFPDSRALLGPLHNLTGFSLGATCGLIYGKPTAKSLVALAIFPPLISLFFSFHEPMRSVGYGLGLGMPIGSIAGMIYKKVYHG